MNIFKAISDYQKVQFSTFDMGNNYIGSINDFGSLNAIYATTVLPGDRWKLGHNVMVKLPPLVSPAFTRIKGVINSFFVKYSSVWKYWNSFISDRPEDTFLSRQGTDAYRGKFVEPRIPMLYIAMICKIAKGYANVYLDISTNDILISFYYRNVTAGANASDQPYSLTWAVDSQFALSRYCTIAASSDLATNYTAEPNFTTSNPLIYHTNSDTAFKNTFTTFKEILGVRFANGGNGNTYTDYPIRLGFANEQSLLVYCCQQCCRNLENFGVPTDIIAKCPFSVYQDDFFNAMFPLALSSIWHNFYRSEQNQSPEFDCREINGSVAPLYYIKLKDDSQPYPANGSFKANDSPYGWWLKLVGLPPSESSLSDYWFKIKTFEDVFSFLTGFYLDAKILQQKSANLASIKDNVNVIPTLYNGFLFMKYRNFADDFFTSASVDPNMGGVSVNVPSTIDALRTANKFEEFLEKSVARDFVTWMQMQYGEKPSDEYPLPLLLGTQIVPVQIGEQLQTSETTANSPLGQRSGIADAYGNSSTVNHKFNDYGCVVSLLSFTIDSQYKDGIAREMLTHLQLDYPFPAFANLGAESISLKEIYYGSDFSYHHVSPNSGNPVVLSQKYTSGGNIQYGDVSASDSPIYGSSSGVPLDSDGPSVSVTPSGLYTRGDANIHYPSSPVYPYSSSSGLVFGYTPRYSRWKFKFDVVAGQMRDSLDYWHTFREFFQVPYIGHNFVSYLNVSFINNINRIFAEVNDNSDKFFVDIFNNGSVRRCLPLVPNPNID